MTCNVSDLNGAGADWPSKSVGGSEGKTETERQREKNTGTGKERRLKGTGPTV